MVIRMSEEGRVFREDYRPPSHTIGKVLLKFKLEDHSTEVTSRLELTSKNGEKAELYLEGEELELLFCRVNDEEWGERELGEKGLLLKGLPESFTLEIGTRIDPANNHKLEGLYKSGSVFCTQMEAEGFRRVTYYPDRPDVMSRFTTVIEADKKLYPQLLSNGNRILEEDLEGGRHRVTWEDPHPKPCYLFALVAGNLGLVKGEHTTSSGREVQLEVYVDKGNEERAQHALDSLRRAMIWDEETFGLEYDLDLYMIVAVDAFNFGAMENKGLNIFNSNAVLADPTSATDDNYQRIEGIVAHEYFHNWTGNRVTCRDWFQLTLKEGLTVFRDQEFSSDTHTRSVFRIGEVNGLREMQFAEDAGPNAHPIKPHSYMEINNFYTSTVYEKGSEVIRMIHTLTGKENFRKGMDLYFERHDGQAVTTNDFVKAMSDASGIDLKNFELSWYDQPGTPRLLVEEEFEEDSGRYRLKVEQILPDAAGENARPYVIPLKLALYTGNGENIELGALPGRVEGHERVWTLSEPREELVVEGLKERPVLSLLRDFSAPVRLEWSRTLEDQLQAWDLEDDEFNRYELGQGLMKDQVFAVLKGEEVDGRFLQAFRQLLLRPMDHALKALLLFPPSLSQLLEVAGSYDPVALDKARESFQRACADFCREELESLYKSLHREDDLRMTTLDMARRKLYNGALTLLSTLGEDDIYHRAYVHYQRTKNMTHRMSALSILVDGPDELRDQAFQDFESEWKDDAVVMNKWFMLQAGGKGDDLIDRLEYLEDHPSYDRRNPNKVRALWGGFKANLPAFHREDGSGYEVMARKIMEIDSFNSGLAAGLAKGFSRYTRLDGERKAAMELAMKKVLAMPKVSTAVREILSNTLLGT